MTGRIEKTVFISYRRTNLPWALAIYQDLHHNGYDVFFDYLSIDSGNFEKVIIENIKTRAHFIVILTPSALERCKEPGDWLRREIETAMDEKRNIVPLMLESFDFGSPLVVQALTGKLATLNTYNGLKVYSEYFFEAMEKLRDKYMNVEVSGIALPFLNAEAKKITETQKSAASEAAPVEKEELTALEWTERGYIFHDAMNFDEAIRCYSEAIRLKPDFAEAYYNRGNAQNDKGNLDVATQDYDRAISLKPDYAEAYNNRGETRRRQGNVDTAITDFTISIELKNPDLHVPYNNRGIADSDKDDLDSAIADYNEAIHLKPDFAEVYHNRALVWEKKKDYSSAIADYQKYLELGGGIRDNYQKEVEEEIKKLKGKLTKKKSLKKKSK